MCCGGSLFCLAEKERHTLLYHICQSVALPFIMKIAHAPTASAVNQHPIDENHDARMSMTEKRARINGHDTAEVTKIPVTNHPTSALGTPSLYPLSCKCAGIESMELRASPQQKMGTMAKRNSTAESNGHAV